MLISAKRHRRMKVISVLFCCTVRCNFGANGGSDWSSGQAESRKSREGGKGRFSGFLLGLAIENCLEADIVDRCVSGQACLALIYVGGHTGQTVRDRARHALVVDQVVVSHAGLAFAGEICITASHLRCNRCVLR